MDANAQDRPTRTRDDVADELRRRIDAGRYATDGRLPSYRQLAAELGAAPNTVGEAVRLLADEGRVRINPNARAMIVDGQPVRRPKGLRDELIEVRDRVRDTRQALTKLDEQLSELATRLPPE